MEKYVSPTLEEINKVGNLFKIIGDSTRLKIIFSLLEGDKTVTELSRATGGSQSLISHQLKILKDNYNILIPNRKTFAKKIQNKANTIQGYVNSLKTKAENFGTNTVNINQRIFNRRNFKNIIRLSCISIHFFSNLRKSEKLENSIYKIFWRSKLN